MKKQNKKEKCEHYWGYKAIGGFPGHEHIHPTGALVCLNCDLSLEDFISQARKQAQIEILEKLKKELFEVESALTEEEDEFCRGWNAAMGTIEKFINKLTN